MKRIFLIVFVLLMFSNSVNAADWELIDKLENSFVYLDRESVYAEPVNKDGSIVILDCWVKCEYKEPLENGVQEDLFQFGFKVINTMNNVYYSLRGVSSYDSEGNLVTSGNFVDSWKRLPPESEGEVIFLKSIEEIHSRKRK